LFQKSPSTQWTYSEKSWCPNILQRLCNTRYHNEIGSMNKYDWKS
jgi:hypothetical protein